MVSKAPLLFDILKVMANQILKLVNFINMNLMPCDLMASFQLYLSQFQILKNNSTYHLSTPQYLLFYFL